MKKASKRSTAANLNRLLWVSAPGHDQAFSEITDLLLEIIMGSLDVNDQMGVVKSKSLLEMFELDKLICDTLGLSQRTWLMVHFDGPSPVIAWEENDMCKMQNKSTNYLINIGIELERYSGRFDLVKLL